MNSVTPIEASRISVDDAEDSGLRRLFELRALRAHFQPIVQLRAATVYGHESLIRGPADSMLHMPERLFAAAREENLSTALEFVCIRVALEAWAETQAPGKLFVNLSAKALTSAIGGGRLGGSLEMLSRFGVPPGVLVIELTEHEQVGDIEALRGVIDLIRLHGVELALDDFGDGRSSLRVWSELKPDYVKIDKYFSHGLSENADKLQTIRALQQIAETFGADLVAEGIETTNDLRALRDLGVRYGQGWYLGRPQALPAAEPLPGAIQLLRSREVAVLPEMRTAATRRITAAQLVVQAPTVTPRTTNDELFGLIAKDEELHAIAILSGVQPVALIDCQHFINRYARPFYKELYGRRSCLMFSNQEPLLVETATAMEQLTPLLLAGDQRYLREGFIITDQGRYVGLGTGQALVKAVTEARVEAARHANPLTFLPGNIPVSQHIDRLLNSGSAFTVGYADLNAFKPYNDHYGYWRGDEMIRLAAAVILNHTDLQRDFVGHIGGDDFIVVFQSRDWLARCEHVVREFNARSPTLFDPEARAAGGITSEDRQGQMRFYGCTTMSIGVACVAAGAKASAESVSAAAAAATRLAKQQINGCFVLERWGAAETIASSARGR